MNIKIKYILTVAAVSLLGLSAVYADGPTIVQSMNDHGTVTVVQPEAMNRRLRPSATVPQFGDSSAIVSSAAPKVRSGYRVQVFDDNNVRTAKQGAQDCKQLVLTHFPDMPVYISFSSPYWRVKVGDFRTRGEAEAFMSSVRQSCPSISKSLRIVRDRINQ